MELTYTLKDFDKKKIIDKYGMQEGGSAQLFLANTCFKRMTKYVPWDTGALATTATIEPRYITYTQPYAHKQFVSNKGKGIRGSRWDLRMKNAEKKQVAKEVEEYAKKLKASR